MSAVMFLFLRPIRKLKISSDSFEQIEDGPLKALKRTGSVLMSKNMLILSITFVYTGKLVY